jgi:hypothetical protein
LHTGGSDTVKDWSKVSSHMSDTFINTIEDPAGADASRQITSIPSPFARIDLVKTAFRQVKLQGALDGKTIYHKIVSDTLDVAQLFFNADLLKSKIEIIAWNAGIEKVGDKISIDKNSDLGKLLHSGNEKHRLYGETLKLFLIQDAGAYNFTDLKRVYLLNYKNGPEPINIIGGTSPATLFFSSGNENLNDYVDIQLGSNKLFNNKFIPLIHREEDFIKYIYALQKSMPLFSGRFKEVDDYLNLSFPKLSDSLRQEINEFTKDSYSETYQDIHVDFAGNNAEILRHPLKGKIQDTGKIPEYSDFTIAATKQNNIKPLVLPNEQFNESLKYVNGLWKSEYKSPYYDPLPVSERFLPHLLHIQYPYLTVSDFLEPYIIQLPYPVNKEKFNNGGFSREDHGFVLPIKKDFFKYFHIQDLDKVLPDGKKMFELKVPPAGGVKAILRVPMGTQGKYIEFSRIYIKNAFSDRLEKPQEHTNTGIISENQFGLSIFPFLKTGSDVKAHYRVMLIDKDTLPLTKLNEYALTFYKDNKENEAVPVLSKRTRINKLQGDVATSNYFVLENEFDYIEVRNQTASGLLIPLFKMHNGGSKQFSFAIDFGTTNTHIEYKTGNEQEKAFDITPQDIQIGSLNYNDANTRELLANVALGPFSNMLINLIPIEFLPEKIGKNEPYSFPQRTVIADNDHFDAGADATYALADFNIPFTYLKENLPNKIEVTPNLKWSEFKHNKKMQKRTEAFLDILLFMIRNKVLLNDGNLKETKIIWFYPSSMSEYRRGVFQSAWEELYKKYFNSDKKIEKMSESIAPFYYYRERAGILAFDKPVACIDIGGGTTDIVIYQDNKPVYLTSFKFAANSIFGDGYGNSPLTNGFIIKHGESLFRNLSNSTAKDLAQIYLDLKGKHTKSIELIEFLFSIESNKKIKDNNIPASFSKDLANDTDIKVVFLLFYSSIIYHLAHLMKKKNIDIPRYITFSGTGSKVLNITDPGSGVKKLADFTKLIFENVYERSVDTPLELKQFADPKEISCKGGLLCNNYEEIDEIEQKIKVVLAGDIDNTVVPEKSIKYSAIENSELLASVEKETNHFIDQFFSWSDQFNYSNKFGINPSNFQQYKTWLKEDVRQYLLAGLREKMAEVQDNNNVDIEETLFFYPLIGAINKLAYKIAIESATLKSTS